jgi:hypothetical protein
VRALGVLFDPPFLDHSPGMSHGQEPVLVGAFDERQMAVYNFAEGRGGVHAREFLGSWSGKLVCDDYSGYKALFEQSVIEVGRMAHARRQTALGGAARGLIEQLGTLTQGCSSTCGCRACGNRGLLEAPQEPILW